MADGAGRADEAGRADGAGRGVEAGQENMRKCQDLNFRCDSDCPKFTFSELPGGRTRKDRQSRRNGASSRCFLSHGITLQSVKFMKHRSRFTHLVHDRTVIGLSLLWPELKIQAQSEDCIEASAATILA